MKYTLSTLFIMMLLTLASCDKGADSPRGFSLPKGNMETGKAVFLKFECLACHTLKGVEDPNVVKQLDMSIVLGGEKTKIVTYAELVTSIINPSHKFSPLHFAKQKTPEGKSKMKVFNDVMTVSELIDLVSFLQKNYTLSPYKQTKYQYYPQ
ncbi:MULTISPECIES: c-type cytochrome [unclassified Colwellia]|uniref:c-type cytochrome n=1 Tax=unclassified Colwellia TaxID=196834 RepID=UPI0015F674AA|nr:MULTISPECIES: c-type cytochrome [unclassified Colwellia]MBA6233857.1 c-type cytochrome [Colwellia sp. MB02u-7]MBA6237327.1 c-type cytochrome [Colwellia sp. MB02u-11]MBA6300327.1 c-type cytochrome [Colwellia sp. MB3u-22]MBA6304663.1 c-type cytochrome [Colwellia sp. MB02u-14]MBA6310918.1 c-type cytochrome [Colwellia sp. MB3u-64]